MGFQSGDARANKVSGNQASVPGTGIVSPRHMGNCVVPQEQTVTSRKNKRKVVQIKVSVSHQTRQTQVLLNILEKSMKTFFILLHSQQNFAQQSDNRQD